MVGRRIIGSWELSSLLIMLSGKFVSELCGFFFSIIHDSSFRWI